MEKKEKYELDTLCVVVDEKVRQIGAILHHVISDLMNCLEAENRAEHERAYYLCSVAENTVNDIQELMEKIEVSIMSIR